MPKRVLRLLSFLIKEILDVVQQPRLVATLIVGPFAILLVFGLGFIGKQGPVDAIVVVPPDAELPAEIEEHLEPYEGFLPVQAVLEDRAEALALLEARQTEMVIVVPVETYSTFRSGEQVVIEVLINEYDPIRSQWLNYVGGVISTDLNDQLLAESVHSMRETAVALQGVSTALFDELLSIGASLESGELDESAARLDVVLAYVDQQTEFLEPAVEAWLGMPAISDSVRGLGGQPEAVTGFFGQFRQGILFLRRLLSAPELDMDAIMSQVESMRNALVGLQATAALIEGIPDAVLVSPVATQITNLSASQPDSMHFYAPAVLALLMQHLAVTFGALTMVHERILGAEELFRVAPIAPWEILTGKYVSYGLLTTIVGLLLSVLVVLVLKAPLLGSVLEYVLVMVLVTTAGLGWGFFISLLSSRESQAVQFTMLLLITSVFFGGFFIALDGLRPEVRVISYALPVTYGVRGLREIMLAGRSPGTGVLLPLLAMSVGFYLASVLIYTWQHKRE